MSGTMKAAVLFGKEDVRVEQVPIPTLGEGEVLLRIEAALTCGTDVKVFRNGSHARMIQPPALFGHEFSGVIESVGAGVSRWKLGMRVVAANSAPCRTCFYCAHNQPNLCENLLFVNGAYAQFLRLPAAIVQQNLLEIPSSLSFESAALTEPLACVVRGVGAVRPLKEETIVVLGAGPVGLLFTQLLSHTGVKVILIGKGARRLQIAQACGATIVVDLAGAENPLEAIRRSLPDQRGADAVVEAVGRPAAWEQAVRLVRPGGRVLFFGGCPSGTQVSFDTKRIHYDELALLSTFHHTPDAVRESLSLIAGGTIKPNLLITDQAPLEKLPAILRGMLTAQDGVKTMIRP